MQQVLQLLPDFTTFKVQDKNKLIFKLKNFFYNRTKVQFGAKVPEV